MGEKIATRLAYGTALAKVAANNNRVIALDADTKNSTFSDKIKVVCVLLQKQVWHKILLIIYLIIFSNSQRDILSVL